MPRLAVAIVAAVLLAACGGDGNPAQREPQTVIQDEDQLRAVNSVLRQSDLSGVWTAAGAEEDDEEEGIECLEELQPDLSDLTVTGEADSDDFSKDNAQVSSSVTVYETEEQATAAFDLGIEALASDDAIDCFADTVEEQAEEDVGEEIGFGETSGGSVSFPEVAEQTEAVEVEIPFEFEGQAVSVFVRFAVMREERALGAVFTFDLQAPYPLDQHVQLAQIVADRMAP